MPRRRVMRGDTLHTQQAFFGLPLLTREAIARIAITEYIMNLAEMSETWVKAMERKQANGSQAQPQA